jgi:hypothetical protein
LPLFDVDIEIITEELNEAKTDLLGEYKTGLAVSGNYEVVFSKPEYYPQTITVNLVNGVLEILDVELEPLVPYAVTGLTLTSEDGSAVSGASVVIQGEQDTFELITDDNGQFEIELYQGTYDFLISNWGFQYTTIDNLEITGENSITVNMEKGYEDDFITDLGWQTSADNANTETGFWVRDIPIETTINNGATVCNPGTDVSGDRGNHCYMTGNGGGTAADDDVDGGSVLLTSPAMDLAEYIDPVLSYRIWWVNTGGQRH